jgi:hypothetical protein
MSNERPGQRAAANREARTKRRILGGSQLKMQTSQRADHVRRWVNDIGGRAGEFEAAGYNFVAEADANSSDVGSRISQVVGSQDNGQPMRAYLMEKPKEWYDEDQREKQALTVDRTEEAIKRGNVEGNVGAEGRYVPTQGIRVTANTSRTS